MAPNVHCMKQHLPPLPLQYYMNDPTFSGRVKALKAQVQAVAARLQVSEEPHAPASCCTLRFLVGRA